MPLACQKEEIMSNQRNRKIFIAASVFCASLASVEAFAAQPAVNTGSTSFMDGFGDPTGYGLLYLNYLSWIGSGSFTDVHGNSSPVFQDPKLNVLVDLNQFLYTFKMPDGAFVQPGLNLIVPLVDTSASSGAGGIVPLSDNGFGLGDLTFGPFAQFKPIIVNHHPVFVHRIEFDLIAPTGKYDAAKVVNPGHNTWGINPYWAATLLPVPWLEISTRINYLYNSKNNNPGEGPQVSSTQSGQAIFDNFTASVEILPHNETRTGAISLRAGLNGYYFKQISENKTNGASGSDTKEQVLGLGPGAMWVATHEDAFWLNVYFETAVENRFASHVVQLRWAHAFASF